MSRAFAVAFVLSLFALSSVGLAQNLVTGDVTRTFTEIKASVPKTITEVVLAPAGTPVFEMRIDVNSQVVQGRVTLEKTSSEKLSSVPGGLVYAYFNVSQKNIPDSKLDSLRVKFRLPKNWLASNGVSNDGVKALLLSGSGWSELDTVLLSEDSENVVYQSESKTFGVFAISGAGAEPQPTSEKEAASDSSGAAVEEGSEESVGEVVSTQEVVEKQSQDQTFWIVVGVIVAVVVVVLVFVPGRIFMKRSYHYRHKV